MKGFQSKYFVCSVRAWKLTSVHLKSYLPKGAEQPLHLLTAAQTQPSCFQGYSFTNTSEGIKV